MDDREKTEILSSAKGVVFDMDGLIFDSEKLWKEAFLKVNAIYGLKLSETYRQSICGKGENLIREELKSMFPSLDADSYRERIISEVAARSERGADVKEGFGGLVSYLKAKGIKTALATSSPRARAEKMFKAAGLDINSLFDGAVFGDCVKNSKPDPEIFIAASAKLRLPPESCVVLEDSLNGIAAARAGGFIPVMVEDLIKPTGEAEKTCLFIAGSLTEVLERFKKRL